MRLLLAEDNEDIRDLLAFALGERGWEVFKASDGRDALKVYHNAVESGDFDVLVLDILMPRLNGFAVGVAIRHFEKFSKVRRAKHVYLTGYDDAVPPEDLLESELLGEPFVDAYLRKPISAEELISEIEKLVSEAAP